MYSRWHQLHSPGRIITGTPRTGSLVGPWAGLYVPKKTVSCPWQLSRLSSRSQNPQPTAAVHKSQSQVARATTFCIAATICRVHRMELLTPRLWAGAWTFGRIWEYLMGKTSTHSTEGNILRTDAWKAFRKSSCNRNTPFRALRCRGVSRGYGNSLKVVACDKHSETTGSCE